MATRSRPAAGRALDGVPRVPEAPPLEGPRLPVLARWVDVDAERYPGFKVKLRANFRQATALEIASGDQERMVPALAKVVLEHNGWRDELGEPFPPATDPAFWTGPDSIPTELAGLVLARIVEEATAYPNSRRPTRAN